MGYSIQHRGEKFCVVDTDSGKVHGCHDTQADAERQMHAIGMNSGKDVAVRDALSDCLSRKIPHLMRSGHDRQQAIAIAYSECGEKSWNDIGDDERMYWLQTFAGKHHCPNCTTRVKRLENGNIGGYGVVWGGPTERDLEGDYFTHHTNFWLNTYHDQPVLFDHALNTTLPGMETLSAEDVKFATVKAFRPDDIGLWLEAAIDEHNEWVDAVLSLIDKGVLHWSSGSTPHMVRRAEDGYVKSWPIVEMSVTPTPAEPRNTEVLRTKHLVNDQGPEGAPENSPTGELARAGAADVEVQADQTEVTEMTLHMDELTVKAVIRAYATQHVEDIRAAVKQGGQMEESLRPLASELAQFAGTDEETALAVLVQFVAENAMPAPAEEPPMPAEGQSIGEGEMLSVSPDQLNQMVEAATAKALGKVMGPQNGGGYKTKNVNLNLNAEDNRPHTLTRWLRATRDHDWAYINSRKNTIKAAYKAMGINPDTAGGYLVAPEHSTQIIELLRSDSVVLPLCRHQPMASNELEVPSLTGGATVRWGAENAQIQSDDGSTGQKLLVAKKMTVMLKVSNELIEDSDPSIDAILREDIARAAAAETDRVILRGTGQASEPQGMLYSNATATALNAALTYATLNAATYRVMVENVAQTPPLQWVLHPRELTNLRELEDTAGNLIWVAGGAPGTIANANPGTLLGYPVNWTTQINIDTTDNNETTAYYGQWNDVLVGMRKTLEIMASQEAGDAFEYDQTWIRAVARMDVVLRHDESIEVLTDIRDS